MSATTPRIWADAWSAYAYLEDSPDERVVLDTPAWVGWLEAPTTASFAYPVFDPCRGYIVGVMTVRKEGRQRGGFYWSAYRRQGGRVRKVYLGPATALTRARLDEVARSFIADQTPPEAGARRATTTQAPADDGAVDGPGSAMIPPVRASLEVTSSHPHSMDAAVRRTGRAAPPPSEKRVGSRPHRPK
jgi:hypothetical protein